MKIELLKPYAMSNAGEIIDPSPVIAKMLIKRKVAKAIRKKKAKK
jgi:hypothetical protein